MSYRTEDEELFSDDEQREDVSKNLDSFHCASTDEEMRALLESWKAPDAHASLDRRVVAAYRKQVTAPLWKRVFASSIRVPLPAAAAVVLLVIAAGSLSLRSILASTTREATNQASQQVHVVEVPVVQEKIVTRTVYIEKRRKKAQMNHGASSGYVAGVQSDVRANAQGEPKSGRYITHADLSGFQPVNQMKIEIISKEKANEN